MIELLEHILEDLGLAEGKLKDLQTQYVDSGKVPRDVFNTFVENEPSGEKHKYLAWMLKQHLSYPERSQHIIDVTNLFDEQVKRGKISGEESDIYKHDLERADQIASEKTELKTRGEEEREIKAEGVKKIAETDRYLIVLPQSYKASCFYGAGTKWCISATTSSYWERYWKTGHNIYVIVDKKENKKYAVDVSPNGSKTVYDEIDNVINYSDLKRRLGIS